MQQSGSGVQLLNMSRGCRLKIRVSRFLEFLYQINPEPLQATDYTSRQTLMHGVVFLVSIMSSILLPITTLRGCRVPLRMLQVSRLSRFRKCRSCILYTDFLTGTYNPFQLISRFVLVISSVTGHRLLTN